MKKFNCEELYNNIKMTQKAYQEYCNIFDTSFDSLEYENAFLLYTKWAEGRSFLMAEELKEYRNSTSSLEKREVIHKENYKIKKKIDGLGQKILSIDSSCNDDIIIGTLNKPGSVRSKQQVGGIYVYSNLSDYTEYMCLEKGTLPHESLIVEDKVLYTNAEKFEIYDMNTQDIIFSEVLDTYGDIFQIYPLNINEVYVVCEKALVKYVKENGTYKKEVLLTIDTHFEFNSMAYISENKFLLGTSDSQVCYYDLNIDSINPIHTYKQQGREGCSTGIVKFSESEFISHVFHEKIENLTLEGGRLRLVNNLILAWLDNFTIIGMQYLPDKSIIAFNHRSIYRYFFDDHENAEDLQAGILLKLYERNEFDSIISAVKYLPDGKILVGTESGDILILDGETIARS